MCHSAAAANRTPAERMEVVLTAELNGPVSDRKRAMMDSEKCSDYEHFLP